MVFQLKGTSGKTWKSGQCLKYDDPLLQLTIKMSWRLNIWTVRTWMDLSYCCYWMAQYRDSGIWWINNRCFEASLLTDKQKKCFRQILTTPPAKKKEKICTILLNRHNLTYLGCCTHIYTKYWTCRESHSFPVLSLSAFSLAVSGR